MNAAAHQAQTEPESAVWIRQKSPFCITQAKGPSQPHLMVYTTGLQGHAPQCLKVPNLVQQRSSQQRGCRREALPRALGLIGMLKPPRPAQHLPMRSILACGCVHGASFLQGWCLGWPRHQQTGDLHIMAAVACCAVADEEPCLPQRALQ